MNDQSNTWIHTLTIIGVNLAIFAVIIQMTLANSGRIDACNARIDTSNQRMDCVQMMIYDALKEFKENKSQTIPQVLNNDKS